ncbi:MAG: hypothetical protein J6Y69_08015, partial [Treponema sp.]|nr:hypothetical protein [Treponema sp.]
CMFGLLFKKNFFDIWDNMFHVLGINVIYTVFLLSGVFGFLGLCSLEIHDGIKIIVLGVAVIVISIIMHILIFAEGKNAEKISNYSAPKMSLFFGNIVHSIKDGCLFGFLFGMIIIVSFVSIPYYLTLSFSEDATTGSFLGLVLAFLVFWILVFVLLGLQWFMAVRNVLHNGFRKCLKKSFILFFDNFWFTVGMALINLLNLLITVFSLSLIPSFTGIQICVTNALHLRMYKYDWYEVNPGMSKEQRRHVPWDQLLLKDRKLFGERKLRTLFIPWKD